MQLNGGLTICSLRNGSKATGYSEAENPQPTPWRFCPKPHNQVSLVAQTVKNLPAVQETWVWFLGQEDPWRRKWQPTPVFLSEESHGWRNLVGYSPWGRKELDTTERVSLIHFTRLSQYLPCNRDCEINYLWSWYKLVNNFDWWIFFFFYFESHSGWKGKILGKANAIQKI